MVTENVKVFIDTNILLYAYSSSEIAKKEKSKAISESPKAITCRFLRLFGFSAGSMECTNLEL